MHVIAYKTILIYTSADGRAKGPTLLLLTLLEVMIIKFYRRALDVLLNIHCQHLISPTVQMIQHSKKVEM